MSDTPRRNLRVKEIKFDALPGTEIGDAIIDAWMAIYRGGEGCPEKVTMEFNSHLITIEKIRSKR